jgi:hypothetical protein
VKIDELAAEIEAELAKLPERTVEFSGKVLQTFLQDLPEQMSKPCLLFRYLVLLYGAEIVSGFAENMLVGENISKEKIRAAREAFQAFVRHTTSGSDKSATQAAQAFTSIAKDLLH